MGDSDEEIDEDGSHAALKKDSGKATPVVKSADESMEEDDIAEALQSDGDNESSLGATDLLRR